MVHSKYGELTGYTIKDDFNNHILESLRILNKTASNNSEIKGIIKDLEKMKESIMNNRNIDVMYPFILDELESVDNTTKSDLIELYYKFNLIKSITKYENVNTEKSTSEKIINFINNASKVEDLLINEIIDCFEKNEKNKVLSLQKIKKEVDKMQENLSKNKFMPSYGRMIVDSWIFSEALGNELLSLKNEYLKL